MASRKKVRAGGGRERGYHHGDLRAALIEAAAELVAEEGEAALSIREVARRAGVSHAAPYHHFPTKEHLLEAVADAGFAKLDTAMEAALQPMDERQPVPRFEALGLAYVRFAATRPRLFRLMFRTGQDARVRGAGLGQTAQRPFARVLAAARACLAAWGDRPSPRDPVQVTMLAWASMHGLATLWTDGALTLTAEALERQSSELASLVASLVRPP